MRRAKNALVRHDRVTRFDHYVAPLEVAGNAWQNTHDSPKQTDPGGGIIMFSHINVGSNDVARTALFYDAFFAPLGINRFWTEKTGRIVGWRRHDTAGHFYLSSPFNAERATPGNGTMSAFTAPSREAVNLAYEAGLAHGGRDEGAPGLRPQYASDYYGAYLRDPDGNKLHVVHRGDV